jgi:hypothetical protein
MLLGGTDAETAEVDLMARVRALVEGRPLRIQGFASATMDSASDQLAMAGVVVSLQTDFQGLLCLLQRVEDESAAMADEAVEVTALEPDRQAAPAEFLVANVTLSGWFRPGPQGDAPRTELDG